MQCNFPDGVFYFLLLLLFIVMAFKRMNAMSESLTALFLQLLKWQLEVGGFEFDIHNASDLYMKGHVTKLKTLYKPCATVRLFMPVSMHDVHLLIHHN